MFTLHEIIRALTGTELNIADRSFSEAAVDSRTIREGMLFAAIPGEQTDGHRFVPAAFAQGAAAALIQEDIPDDFACLDLRDPAGIENFAAEVDLNSPLCIYVENTVEALQRIAAFHRSCLQGMDVVGITGTVGKTTTKELVFDVLSRHYRTMKTAGNMNNEIGLPLTLLRADENIEQAILEMGFYVPGEIDQLCRIARPSVGVITNVGMVHASRAGSMEVIAKGKSELVQALPSDGVAILNYDDPYVRPMAEKTNASVFYYGEDPAADLYADNVHTLGLEGISFDLNYQGEKHSASTPLVGKHSVMTALRAAAVGLVKNMSWDEILDGLHQGRNQLRLRITRTISGGVLIDDSYNASPESTTAALNLLSEMKGRRIAVLGEMRELGQYEEKGHRMVGERAAEACDVLITVGPVTRFLADAAIANGMRPENVHLVSTAEEAIELLRGCYGIEGDVMLVKGSRAMGLERIINVMEAKA